MRETQVLYSQEEYAELIQNDFALINGAWAIKNTERDLADVPESIVDAIGEAALRFRALADLLGAAEWRLLQDRSAGQRPNGVSSA